MLDPETFKQMQEEMARMGVKVKRADTRALDATLSVESTELKNDTLQAIFMVGALGALPVLVSTILVWAFGLFLDLEFVPEPSWGALLSFEAIPLFLIGLAGGLVLTGRLLEFLDLQNPEIMTGSCPCCGGEVKLFSGGAAPEKLVDYACTSCGFEMVIDTRSKRIVRAGMGAEVEATDKKEGFNWSKAWETLKEQARPIFSK